MLATLSTEVRPAVLKTLLTGATDRTESFLSRHTVLTVLIFTVAYIPYVCARALLKPLWYDELATLAVSQLHSTAGILRALYQGIEPNPPLVYLLTHWSLQVTKNELIAARIPSIFGFWLMCVCLYLFACRRGWRIAAFLALLFPFATDLFYYATEARPYGILLGFAALALLAWQRARQARRRTVWLLVLFLSLAAAMYSHYYGILVPLPLLCGDLARLFKERVLDRVEVGTVFGSYLAFISLMPLASAQTHRLGLHWAQPVWQTVVAFYSSSLAPFLLPLLFIVLAVAFFERIFGRRALSLWEASPSYDELVAIFAFFCIPIFTYVLALLVTHTYTGRYSIAALIGMSLLFWWLATHFFRATLELLLVAVVILTLWIVVDEARTIRRALHFGSTVALEDIFPFQFPGDLPIVIQDPRDYLQMVHYAPSNLVDRLYYIAEPEEAMKYEGSVGLDISLRDLSKVLPLQVTTYKSFVKSHPQFFLFWGKPKREGLIGWQLSKLEEGGAKIELTRHSGQRLLFHLEMRDTRYFGFGAGWQPAGALPVRQAPVNNRRNL